MCCLTLKVLQQAAICHQLCDYVDGILQGANGIQLNQLGVPQPLHDLSLSQEVLCVHGACQRCVVISWLYTGTQSSLEIWSFLLNPAMLTALPTNTTCLWHTFNFTFKYIIFIYYKLFSDGCKWASFQKNLLLIGMSKESSKKLSCIGTWVISHFQFIRLKIISAHPTCRSSTYRQVFYFIQLWPWKSL